MWSIGSLLILCVVLAGCVGILYAVCQGMGIQIPGWVRTVGWIVLAVVVGVVAIRLLLSLV